MTSTVNDRFILAEEVALKARCEGLGVHDPRDPDGALLPVDVWFRWPNKEIREVKYPFISLDLADIVKSDRREHSGAPFELRYEPHNYESTIQDGARMAQEWPTPFDLVYTVTIVSLDPRHDRELKYKLLGDRARFPYRGGYLEAADEATRYFETLSVDTPVARDAKRTQFFTVFTIRVETELFVGQVEDIHRVQIASITLKELITGVTEELQIP